MSFRSGLYRSHQISTESKILSMFELLQPMLGHATKDRILSLLMRLAK